MGKPTTGEHEHEYDICTGPPNDPRLGKLICNVCGEPKPTTGEWTEAIIIVFRELRAGQIGMDIAYNRINDAHNTALAAEREQGVKALAQRSFELHECQQQLAAAMSLHEAAENIRTLWLKKPVSNDPDWHAAVLALIQALDEADAR